MNTAVLEKAYRISIKMWWPFGEWDGIIENISMSVTSIQSHLKEIITNGPCGVCGTASNRRCGGCSAVFYCSKKHQQTDWAKHKVVCRPFTVPTQFFSTNNNISVKKGDNKEQYLSTTRAVGGGSTLFFERPWLTLPFCSSDEKPMCLGCYKTISIPIPYCKRCLLPLCHPECELHTQEECKAIGEVVAKNRGLMFEKIENGSCYSRAFFKDYSILRLLIQYKSPKFAAFLKLKSHPRYMYATKFPTEALKEWTSLENYHLADIYFKSYVKDKSFSFEEVIRLCAIFSDTSFFNKNLLVLYEIKNWIVQSCTPNAEFHFSCSDSSQTLYLKLVDNVKADSVISVNYIHSYVEGVSKGVVRLWNNERMFCEEKGCHCRVPGRMDSSVGVRCQLSNFCSGIIAPLLEPPNPEKPSLGQLIYVKSRPWKCSDCGKFEKWEKLGKDINKKIVEAKRIAEEYNKNPDINKYSVVKEKLCRIISNQHWLWDSINQTTLRILKDNKELLGSNGKDMLCKMMQLSPGEERKNFLKYVQICANLTSDGLQNNILYSNESGFLSTLGSRYGRLSYVRSEALLYAFFSNWIIFVEDFRAKLIKVMEGGPSQSMQTLASDTLGKMRLLLKMVNDAAMSLRPPSTASTSEDHKKSQMALEILQILQTTINSTFKTNKVSIIKYMEEYLELYHPIPGKPYCSLDDEEETLPFDVDGQSANNLTFGQAIGGSSCKPKFSETFHNHLSDDDDIYGNVDMPNWSSFLDSSSDDDDSENDRPLLDTFERLITESIRQRKETEDLLDLLFN